MREIVLDTETTGLDPKSGDRLVEIGCVELINHVATGKTYHQQVNPERDMPEEAFRVHGLSTEYLATKPVFKEVADEFLEFIGEDKLVIHNASFDMKFLNFELEKAGYSAIPMSRAIDTLEIARNKFPGMRNNLDVLCQRFEIDNSRRTKHGALLDSELLAEVYLELIGGKEPSLLSDSSSAKKSGFSNKSTNDRVFREPRPHKPLAEEKAAHEELMKKIDNPLWD